MKKITSIFIFLFLLYAPISTQSNNHFLITINDVFESEDKCFLYKEMIPPDNINVEIHNNTFSKKNIQIVTRIFSQTTVDFHFLDKFIFHADKEYNEKELIDQIQFKSSNRIITPNRIRIYSEGENGPEKELSYPVSFSPNESYYFQTFALHAEEQIRRISRRQVQVVNNSSDSSLVSDSIQFDDNKLAGFIREIFQTVNPGLNQDRTLLIIADTSGSMTDYLNLERKILKEIIELVVEMEEVTDLRIYLGFTIYDGNVEYIGGPNTVPLQLVNGYTVKKILEKLNTVIFSRSVNTDYSIAVYDLVNNLREGNDNLFTIAFSDFKDDQWQDDGIKGTNKVEYLFCGVNSSELDSLKESLAEYSLKDHYIFFRADDTCLDEQLIELLLPLEIVEITEITLSPSEKRSINIRTESDWRFCNITIKERS